MDDESVKARLDVIEGRLNEISAELARLSPTTVQSNPATDALVAKLDGVLKAQLLLGALTESGQETLKRQISETLPNEVANQLGGKIGAEISALSDRLTAAIGQTMGDQAYGDLLESGVAHRPLESILHALDLLDAPSPAARNA